MTIEIHLYSQSQPVTHIDILNTYTKDGLFCVLHTSRVVTKYPTQHIFRIVEVPE